MSKILIVEDDGDIAELERDYLEASGFDTLIAHDGRKGLSLALGGGFDLVILDLMLPGEDGLSVCRSIRERSGIPVIMVTARSEDIDVIRGLGIGANDYVTKPFLPLELVARVKAQLRRYTTYNAASGARGEKDGVIACRGLLLDVPAHEATLNERPLALTPTEFSLLRILLEADGAVVSARELYQRIFGDEYYERGSGSITVHVRHLREKMGDSFEDPRYIKTVWGMGFKLA